MHSGTTHKNGLEESFWQMRLVVASSMTEAQADSATHSTILPARIVLPFSVRSLLRGSIARTPTALLCHQYNPRNAVNRAVHKNACFRMGSSHSSRNGYPSSPSKEPRFEMAYSR